MPSALFMSLGLLLLSKGNRRLVELSSSTETTNECPRGTFDVPATWDSIPTGYFHSCSTLRYVTMSDSVTKIGDNAFHSCFNLQTVGIGDSVTRIGSMAFFQCINLLTITIPQAVMSIGFAAFQGCSVLQRIVVSEKNPRFIAKDGALFGTHNMRMQLIQFPPGKTGSYQIPDFTADIFDYAFGYDGYGSAIRSVTIPDSVETIGSGAFTSCTNLAEVKFGKNIRVIGRDAFSYCSSLVSVELPDSLISIEDQCFLDCTSLKNVTFGKCLIAIGDRAFANTALESVILPGTIRLIGEECFHKVASLVDLQFEEYDPDAVTQCTYPQVDEFTGEDQPAGGENPPTGGENPPTGGENPPTGGENPPAEDEDQPTGGENPPTGGENPPTGGENPPAEDEDQPAGGENPPTGGENPPTGGENPPAEDEDQPAGVKLMEGEKLPEIICDESNITCTDSIIVPQDPPPLDPPDEGTGLPDGEDRCPEFDGSGSFEDEDYPDGIIFPDGGGFPEHAENRPHWVVGFIESLTIGARAFSGCSLITSVLLPEVTRTIKDEIFSGCTSLVSIDLGNIQEIPPSAFAKCKKLTNVTIPRNNTWYDSKSFADCESLESIYVADATYYMEGSAFSGCKKLREFIVDETSQIFEAFDGVLLTKEEQELNPDGVTYKTCRYMVRYPGAREGTEYIVHENVTKFKSYAFYECPKLEKIVIPAHVDYVGSRTFYKCTALKEIQLPKLASISDYMFQGCTSLRNLEIPASVEFIGKCPFSGCTSLTVTVEPGATYFKKTEDGTIWSNAEDRDDSEGSIPLRILIMYVGQDEKYIIDSGIGQINERAFEGSAVKTLIIPSTVAAIASNAISGSSIEHVTMEAGVKLTALPSKMFDGCQALKSVIIKSYYSIGLGDGVFQGCTSLTDLEFPESVSFIGASAFKGCTSLKTLKIDPKCQSIGEGAFASCTSLTSFTLPTDITAIPANIFDGCAELRSVVIGNQVQSVGDYAFNGCDALGAIHLPQTVHTIGSYSFADCHQLGFITLHKGITNIGSYAFMNCWAFTELNLPESLQVVGEMAFANCEGITYAEFAGITQPKAGANVFYNCSHLAEVKVPLDYAGTTFMGVTITKKDADDDIIKPKHWIQLVIIIAALIVIVAFETLLTYVKNRQGSICVRLKRFLDVEEASEPTPEYSFSEDPSSA